MGTNNCGYCKHTSYMKYHGKKHIIDSSVLSRRYTMAEMEGMTKKFLVHMDFENTKNVLILVTWMV